MADSRPDLDRSLARGLAWTGAVKWGSQVISWVATMAVARVLGPGDYGVAGLAMVYVGAAQVIGESGFTAAVIQNRQLPDRQVSALHGLSILTGIALFAITVGLAYPLEWFFDEPQLRNVLIVMGATFVARGLQVVPRALMSRDLQFRTWALLDGVESLIATAVSLVLALAGFGPWALVLATVVTYVVTAVASLIIQPVRIRIPRQLTRLREELALGRHVVGAGLAWYSYSNADFAVAGRTLGTAALGGYSFAWSIASIPVERVSRLVGRVTPAFFSAVQHDPVELRRYFARLTETLAFVTLPACAGLSLAADDFVLAILGPSWAAAITPLRILAGYAAFRSVVTLAPQVLIATGHSKQSMHYSLLTAAVMIPLFILGSRWGTTGIALVWVLAYPVLAAATFLRRALRAIAMAWPEYLGALAPALAATALMAVPVWAAGFLLPDSLSPVARLAARSAVGVLIYGAVLATRYRARLNTVIRLLRPQPARPAGSIAAASTS